MSVCSLGYFYRITVVTLLDTCTFSTYLKIINKRDEGDNMYRVGRDNMYRVSCYSKIFMEIIFPMWHLQPNARRSRNLDVLEKTRRDEG